MIDIDSLLLVIPTT